MGIIKSADSPQQTTPFSMKDIEIQAVTLLVRARKSAELLLTEAQKEADSMLAAAKDQGFAQGQAEGLAKGLEEGRKQGYQAALNEQNAKMTQVWTALNAATSQLNGMRIELENQAVRDVVDLAIAISRRVTKRQSLIDPGVLFENIHEALSLAIMASDVRIAVHPSQRVTIEQDLPRIKLNWPALKHVELIEDKTLTPGGCRIATRGGEIDGDIQTQLDRVIAELMPNVDDAK